MNVTDAKKHKFAMAYVGDAKGSPVVAYKLSHPIDGLTENEISYRAQRTLKLPIVQEFIASHQKRVADKFEIARVEILRTWWAIATADPNELIQAQRRCCRYCHGVGFEYQWRDVQEWAEAMAQECAAAEREKREPRAVSDAGGFGFNHTAEPVIQCTKCRGDGVTHVQVMDTRKLSPAAKLLYAGVKVTRDGIEIKMRSQDEALANLAKALQVFGDDNKPGVAFNFNFNGKTSAAEATKLYKELLG